MPILWKRFTWLTCMCWSYLAKHVLLMEILITAKKYETLLKDHTLVWRLYLYIAIFGHTWLVLLNLFIYNVVAQITHPSNFQFYWIDRFLTNRQIMIHSMVLLNLAKHVKKWYCILWCCLITDYPILLWLNRSRFNQWLAEGSRCENKAMGFEPWAFWTQPRCQEPLCYTAWCC